jgi:hypothetical protein
LALPENIYTLGGSILLGMRHILILLARILYLLILIASVVGLLTFFVFIIYAWVEILTGKVHFH